MLITTIASRQIEAVNSSSQPNNKKYGDKMKEKLADWTYTPYLAMVTISLNLKYSLYENHTLLHHL